jgi:serine/threonine protein kinase
LGTYEITALLGKGGFGDVYRAKDKKLKRDVAIKILPDEFSTDHDRLTRFQREAEVLASLNHPNIAAIYDLAAQDQAQFLVLELVDGETLADRIARGPVPVEEALNIAKQICEALEAAHDRGVIHRDLKPANIKITPDGKVKVLDFGLARIYAKGAETDLANSPTLTAAGSIQGVIIGTPAYMSPEQARGRDADHRSDVFALGCILYEMLTGRQTFEGEGVSEVLASVLRGTPDPSALPANVSPRVRALLSRCLEKNPKRRWQAVGDLRIEIENAIAGSPEDQAPMAALPKRSRWKVAALLEAAAAVIGLAVILYLWAPVVGK